MIHLCMCHFINRIDVLILQVGELFHTMMLLSVLSLATSFFRHTLQAKDRPCKLRDCHWIRNSMIRLEVLGGGMTWVGDLNGLLRVASNLKCIAKFGLSAHESCWTFLNIDASINQYMFKWCSWIITLDLSVP